MSTHARSYVSSYGFGLKSVDQILQQAAMLGLKDIEWTAGTERVGNLDTVLPAACDQGFNFLTHNYFPPPETPFVLNTSAAESQDQQVLMDFVEQGLTLAQLVGAPCHSVHAGFAFSVSPDALGNGLSLAEQARKAPMDREQAVEQMVDNCQVLADRAADLDLALLIENNVLAPELYGELGYNPLLGVTADELLTIISAINRPNVGLLLDVAHLKVSGQTLGFDCIDAIERLAPVMHALHLSDNDGSRDNNRPFDQDAWFMPLLT
ncbi:MAG: TIM barrel protein, partial [Pseudomonadota bacterium]